MDFFIKHKIIETPNGPTILLYLNPNQTEFAQELGSKGQGEVQRNLESAVKTYIHSKIGTNIPAKIVKIMFGTILIATMTMNDQAQPTYAAENPANSYTQQSSDINIVMDGKPLVFSQKPMIINGTTYIPIRGVAEAYGASVWWNGDSQTVGINKDDTKIAFQVGSSVARVNGQQMSVQPSLLIEGSVMVPLRFVSSTLGLTVDWNGDTRTVSINSPTTKATYSVVAGDTLWGIAQKYGVTVNDIRQTNNLASDTLYIGQALVIRGINPKVQTAPKTPAALTEATNVVKHQVVSGDTLYKIATTYNTSVDQIKKDNNLSTDTVYVGQELNILTKTAASTPVQNTVPSTYKVISGDTLTAISNKFNVPIASIKQLNNLTSDAIFVGQILKLTTNTAASTAPINNNQTEPTASPTITYNTHIIQQGDNMWTLSVKYGIPMPELLKVNNMTSNSPLSIGQKVLIPVHHIPVQSTVSEKHGEYLDWWTEAQYIFSTNKVAKITDMETGKSFMVKRTTGASHADNEPVTAADAAIIKQVWGGTYSWKTRPIIVEVDGRKIAASMSSMPHDVEYIKGENNFNGHFDIHFKNSTRHKDGAVDYDHQAKIKIAAGIQS